MALVSIRAEHGAGSVCGDFLDCIILRFLAREPMLIGILKVLRLPPQCTFWRFFWPPCMEVSRSNYWKFSDRCDRRVWEAGAYQTDGGDAGYGYDGAYGIWETDGSKKELQPQEQREEKLPTHSNVSGGKRRSMWAENCTTEIVPAGCRSPGI